MSRRIRWVVHVACIVEKRNAYRILVEKPEGKRPLRRSRQTGEVLERIVYSSLIRRTENDKIRGINRHTYRQQGDFISLLFFQTNGC
jgi:hypothetical protein